MWPGATSLGLQRGSSSRKAEAPVRSVSPRIPPFRRLIGLALRRMRSEYNSLDEPRRAHRFPPLVLPGRNNEGNGHEQHESQPDDDEVFELRLVHKKPRPKARARCIARVAGS